MKVDCVICSADSECLFSKADWGHRYDFYRCRQCTHVFIWPMPEGSVLKEFYNIEYYVSDFQKAKVRQKAEYCFPSIDLSKRPMLEIGCSYGYFLEWMREKDVAVEGIELSQKASIASKEKGFSVFNGALSAFPCKTAYGTVFMFDVLEHIPDLKLFLEDLETHLQEGSELILTVPNQDSLEFRLFKGYWEWSSPPAHLQYFNIKSMENLLKQYHFKITEKKSFRGDSAGNFFFHFFDSMKRAVLFKIGRWIYGEEKFLAKKKSYNLTKKEERQNSSSEFHGVMRALQVLTNLLNPLDRLFRNPYNSPTLFIRAVKDESEN